MVDALLDAGVGAGVPSRAPTERARTWNAAAEEGDLDRVGEYVLAVGGAVLQGTEQTYQIVVHAA